MRVTQQQIAEHLDLSQKSVSEFLNKLGLDWRAASLDEIRVAYIWNLRDLADGHGSDGGNLVMERVLTERVDRELKEFALAEKKAQLVSRSQLDPELRKMVRSFRADLRKFDIELKSEIDALYSIDVNVRVFDAYGDAAFSHFGDYFERCPTGTTVEV